MNPIEIAEQLKAAGIRAEVKSDPGLLDGETYVDVNGICIHPVDDEYFYIYHGSTAKEMTADINRLINYIRSVSNMKSMKFEDRLDKALKPIMEADAKPVKLDGGKKKTTDGAHKFDGPVSYTELEVSKEFEDRKHKQSKQARPDLPK